MNIFMKIHIISAIIALVSIYLFDEKNLNNKMNVFWEVTFPIALIISVISFILE